MEFIKILKSGERHKLRKYRIYKDFLSDYLKNKKRLLYVWKIHKKGFTVEDWEICRLNKSIYKNYLSSKKYASIHPINGYYSKIIDDKLGIKYLFSGTDLKSIMPEYYFIIDEDGIISGMMDLKRRKDKFDIQDVIELLKEKNELALKLLTGSLGKGFYRLSLENDNICVNGKPMTPKDFDKFIQECRNYAIMEYLRPHPELAKYWSSTSNTIRYLTGKVNGEWRMIKSYIRFGSNVSGEVENFARGGVLCYLSENGEFSEGLILKKGKPQDISTHPDNGVKLMGKIPEWNKILDVSKKIQKFLPMTKYMGYDFVVTDKQEVKLLEINSLTSLDGLQMKGSILETENGKWFFKSLLN